MKRIALRGKLIPYVLISLLMGLGVGPEGASAAMHDYCQVPPYVIQNIPPNVMLMVDISGSMHQFAYFDGFGTLETGDDNLCENSAIPCTGFKSGYSYYGYFNSGYWYAYSNNRFVPVGLRSGFRPANSWDGNFLNWLTMRRTDILRKALTGGKTTTGESSGYDRLVGEIADCDARGRFKEVSNAQEVSPYSGSILFTVNAASSKQCDGFGSGTSSFFVGKDTYNVAVRVPIPVEGVLQRVVGARARLGVTFYNVNEGGYVQVDVAGGSLPSTVNQINLTRANANTPMAETLWTIAGDFAQQASILGGPGPMYKSGDYQTNPNKDPMNFGTGENPRWPVCQKNFVLLITDGEPCSDGNLPDSLKDYASGKSAFDCEESKCPAVDNTTSLAGAGLFSFPDSTIPVCVEGGYTSGIEDVALFAHTTDLRNSPVIGTDSISGEQNLMLYTVFAFGQNSTLIKYTAINGGFEDLDGSKTPNQWDEWDANHDGKPDNYYEATDGTRLEQAIEDAFQSILKRASSGTAASVLASGEGSGANLVQAVFYPRRRFGNEVISWTGSLQNVWYFVDPYLANASIREETPPPDNKLNLAHDYIAQYYFDTDSESTKVKRYADTDGDGDADQDRPTVGFEQLGNIWEAGAQLWVRDLSVNPREIYTTTNGTSLIPFSVADAGLLSLTNLQASTSAERENIIRFVHGEDIIQDLDANLVNDFRQRTVTFGIDNAVWKLGDIINSTPRIVGGVPLNRYHEIYQDSTYSAFTGTSAYKNRGMVFAGGNDGMLHAFKLGKLELSWPLQTATEKARISNPDLSAPLGNEEWAFIPRNAQPYLKYLMDPGYCHLFYTDLSPYVFDASIGGDPTDLRTATSWKTILIGGMRNGGACRDTSSSCTDCVKTPISNLGYSSYFALDVTDPANPSLLWEFSNPELGFATTGPAVIRINSLNPTSGSPDRSLNGKWYVVLGSGPTGPIDSTSFQFLGRSDQNLQFFILDLKTGNLIRTINTGIPYAFAGSMINNVADFNLDYQDDAVYVGYVKQDSSTGTWTQGGVGRLVTKTGVSPSFGDPSAWNFSKVIDDIGPVTSSVARLQNNTYHASWLFFGTGRYFFELPPEGLSSLPTVDDGFGQRKLFGVKEPCFTLGNVLNPSCTTTVLSSNLTDVTSIVNVPTEGVANSAGFSGWFIDLEPAGNYSYDNTAARFFRAERVITDPLATTGGIVFFTTYKPYGDECALGGKSFLWATKYNTGGVPNQAFLKGKALVQVSTASIEQLDLSTAFQGDTTLHKGGRRSVAIEGVPPIAQGLSLISPPPPVKRIMHIWER